MVLPASILKRPPKMFLNFPFGSARQDGYPPVVFKRLDSFIKLNGFRARDVFITLDERNVHAISPDEMIMGLRRIDFEVNKEEEQSLREWMQQIVAHDLAFKDFSLALK
ncbi:hypothetical protein Poli38472_007183 [Pythium oligandrum]|uniref:Uncharacterized protein n=1 Tax=Pythium oligandrum TaxID=41045 RepID=A0A8K1FHS0_PYTOL|nr:hypothetical protein Poli38472_007183 [Pythium oligandrum]|eukprot:TMW59038.1 hypothetical protein Poli38472_007183 [Pythium oligandrum]